MFPEFYQKVSNKTVRYKEKFKKVYRKSNRATVGTLVKTNRGYFINGVNVDRKSVTLWFAMNSDPEIAKHYREIYNEQIKREKEKEKEAEHAGSSN